VKTTDLSAADFADDLDCFLEKSGESDGALLIG
jgi:hypothetical protein